MGGFSGVEKMVRHMRPATQKIKAYRHRLKIFTSNNHYEWSKVPVVPAMPMWARSIYIVVEKFIVS
jgi:ribosomal protein L13